MTNYKFEMKMASLPIGNASSWPASDSRMTARCGCRALPRPVLCHVANQSRATSDRLNFGLNSFSLSVTHSLPTSLTVQLRLMFIAHALHPYYCTLLNINSLSRRLATPLWLAARPSHPPHHGAAVEMDVVDLFAMLS
jgi:hypothetical protein